MATYAYDDFRIEFDPERDGRYPVRARTPRGAQVLGEFVVPVGQADLERAVLGVIRGLRTTRRATWGPADTSAETSAETSPGPVPTDVDLEVDLEADPDTVAGTDGDGPLAVSVDRDVTRFGASLADALFAGRVGAAYDTATDSVADGHGVRLTLALGRTPELLGLPWELLYRRPVFLASQRRTPLLRELIAGRRVAPPTIDGVVRMLGVVASPTDLDPLRVDVERDRIVEAVEPMVKAGRVQLDWLDPASPRGLQKALRDGSYHIVHFVGHSDVASDGEGMLFLEEPDTGVAVPVDGTVLANLLADQVSLRLVVLNSCKGARTSLQDAYAGIATTLVGLGVPAVVAMQFEISDEAAVVFAEELYTNLVGRKAAIDVAVAEARKAVLAGIGNGEWATPVLFVQDPDVALFHFPSDEGAKPEPAKPVLVRERLRHGIARRPRAALVAGVAGVLVVTLVAAALWWPDDRAAPATTTATSTTTATIATTATTTTVVPTQVVRFPSLTVGDTGLVVQVAQLMLRSEGHGIDATGEIDEATAAAIREFDSSENLPVDAHLGELTWSKLVPTLRRGAGGEAVLAGQVLLNANGASVAMDGEFSAPTEGAIKAFERTVGLWQDGILDYEVWKHLIAGVHLETPAKASIAARPRPGSDSVATTTTEPIGSTTTVRADRPRGRSTAVAVVVPGDTMVEVRTVVLDAAAAEGLTSNPAGAVDGNPVWASPTNRLAFDRRRPASDEVGIFYMVPGVSDDDQGKLPAPLIIGRRGTERLPAWSPDGGLLYVATSGCTPAPDCPDNVRRATFIVSDDQPVEGPYVGPVSLDTLTIRSDLQAAGPFTNVTALAADPSTVESFAVIDNDGVWLVAPGGRTLIVAGASGSLSFTSDGQHLLVGDTAALGGAVALYDRSGALIANATLSEVEPSSEATTEAAIPSTGRVLSLSYGAGSTVVTALVDDPDDALPGVVVDIDASADGIAIDRTLLLPTAVLGDEPATAVAI